MTHELKIATARKQQVLDITDEVAKYVGRDDGLCAVFAAHTTCAVTTADLDPGTDLDLLDALQAMIPKLSYRHPHDPSHVWTHIASSVIGPSVTVPVQNGALVLGTWQRIVLIELDGPRERTIMISYR